MFRNSEKQQALHITIYYPNLKQICIEKDVIVFFAITDVNYNQQTAGTTSTILIIANIIFFFRNCLNQLGSLFKHIAKPRIQFKWYYILLHSITQLPVFSWPVKSFLLITIALLQLQKADNVYSNVSGNSSVFWHLARRCHQHAIVFVLLAFQIILKIKSKTSGKT